ncbi:MAG: hypothetical protein A2138_23275 [Deltaproteobacteria bacterium RBG_16_71_12]|nr:MAG: hypothetical protein A2138_23275 [Deltaproteobacteria bacterium RBG_16_71_12]
MSALLLALVVSTSSPEAAAPRPAAAGFTARDLQGRRVRLDELRGRVVVLAFWASWCAPCLGELQALDALQRRHAADGLTVIAVAGDGPDTATRVTALARQRGWRMRVVHDVERRLFARFDPSGETPWLVVIDRRGRVVSTHAGYAPGDERALAAQLAATLGEP